jgi:hypothetical protein
MVVKKWLLRNYLLTVTADAKDRKAGVRWIKKHLADIPVISVRQGVYMVSESQIEDAYKKYLKNNELTHTNKERAALVLNAKNAAARCQEYMSGAPLKGKEVRKNWFNSPQGFELVLYFKEKAYYYYMKQYLIKVDEAMPSAPPEPPEAIAEIIHAFEDYALSKKRGNGLDQTLGNLAWQKKRVAAHAENGQIPLSEQARLEIRREIQKEMATAAAAENKAQKVARAAARKGKSKAELAAMDAAAKLKAAEGASDGLEAGKEGEQPAT